MSDSTQDLLDKMQDIVDDLFVQEEDDDTEGMNQSLARLEICIRDLRADLAETPITTDVEEG